MFKLKNKFEVFVNKGTSKNYFCIFGGGAIRGLAYIGALNAMQELGIVLNSFAGSSVGAVFAAFAALDYTTDEYKEIFAEVNFDLFRDVQFNFAKKFAISKGEHFLEWIRTSIEKKFYGSQYKKNENMPVTFKDVDKDLFVITTNINGCEPYIFSKYTTPDFEIAQAVKISTSLPGLFEPCVLGDKLLIDGDIMKSWPMWATNELLCPKDCRIIEFRLEGAKNWNESHNSVEYLNSVFATMSNFATEFVSQKYKNKDKFDYISINTQHILPVQFTLPQKERENLVKLGYETTKNYFTNILVQKKKDLLLHYTAILDVMIKLKNCFVLNNISNAQEHLYKLFVYLCDAKEFIEEDIYNDIIMLKDSFFSNLQESFFLKKQGLKNKKQVEIYLNKIHNVIIEKCMEIESYINEFS